mmetsp:Transcript_40555/g.126845  ORF Transcript_40555/g.126845 Transcript_40555/m.126845 type:complete len:227 (+) Transcript_40555:803-1483(+)
MRQGVPLASGDLGGPRLGPRQVHAAAGAREHPIPHLREPTVLQRAGLRELHGQPAHGARGAALQLPRAPRHAAGRHPRAAAGAAAGLRRRRRRLPPAQAPRRARPGPHLAHRGAPLQARAREGGGEGAGRGQAPRPLFFWRRLAQRGLRQAQHRVPRRDRRDVRRARAGARSEPQGGIAGGRRGRRGPPRAAAGPAAGPELKRRRGGSAKSGGDDEGMVIEACAPP